MRSLNELLDETEDRRRYFMRGGSVIPEEADTRPRDEKKREAVLLLEIQQIIGRVDMSPFSKPPKELVKGWASIFKKD